MEGKKRKIRVHRGLTFALAIVLTVAIVVVVFQRSGVLSYQLSQYVNDHYFKDTPFEFSCGKVTSDLVSQASIADAAIRYHDGGQSVKVISVDEITMNFDVLEILKLKMIIGHLGLDKVRISLWYDEEGKPIVPAPRDLGAFSGQAVSPQVEIRRFTIRDLQFAIEKEDAPFSIKDVDLSGSARYVDGKGKIEVDQGRAYLSDKDKNVSSIRAAVEFGNGRVSVNDVVVRLEESLVMLSGVYENGRLQHVQGVFNPLNLDELSSLGWISDQHGEVGGSIVVNGTRDSLAVEGSLTGRALGLVFSGLSLKGVVTPRWVRLSSVDGEVHGCRFNGDVAYDRTTGGYTLQGVCEGFDLTQGFVPDGGVPETNLNGSIHVAYDGEVRAYDARADLKSSVIGGFEGDEIQFAGRWSEKTGLDLRRFTLTRAGVALEGFGKIDSGGKADFVLNLTGSDLDYVVDYLSLPRIGGTVDLTAKLVGPLDALQVNVNGSWRDLTYLSARIDSAEVHADARNVRSPRAVATVNVDGRRLYVGGQEFSFPHVLFEVGGENVTVRDFSFSKGDTLITTDFDVETRETETSILVKHIAVQTPEMTWRNRSQTRVTLDGASTVIDTLVITTNGHELGVSGRYTTTSNTSDLRLWGRNIDLSLVPWATGRRFRLAGVGSFEAAVRGDLDNPDFRLSADVRDGVVGDVVFTRLALEGEFTGDGYRLDRLCVTQGQDSLDATGWWKCAQSPVALAKTGLDKDEAWNADIFLEARGERFPMTQLVKKVYKDVEWDGVFSGRATIERTLAAPKMALSGVAISRADSGLVLPDIRADLVYESGRLTVKSLSADDGKNKAAIEGTLPLGFGITKGFEFNRSAPVDFSADVAVEDLSVVTRHIDAVAAATGKFTGHLDVRGAADEPRFAGDFRVRDAALRLAGSDEVFRDINADVTVRENRVTLTSLTAHKEKKGVVDARGTAMLKGFGVPEYAIDLTLTEVPLSTVPGFQSVQSGRIRVKSDVGDRGQSVPFVTGSLDVREAVITRSLAAQEGPPSPLTMPTESPSWLCDLELHAPKNVWIRNPEVNMEMGGDLVLKRDRTGLYLRGDLSVLRGSYTLYNNTFRITDGRFDFATATTLRPGVYLDAYTPYGRAGEVEHKIFLSLSWPPDEKEPKITLSYSEPGYSDADIWAMLGGQVVTGGTGFAEGGTWNPGETASSLASNYLERILNAQMSNTTIAVESSPVGDVGRSRGGESEVSIVVGRYLSEDFYLNYRQGLRITGAREIGIEYRLSNMLLLRSEIIQYSQKGFEGTSRQATDEINFDIKFRWEY